MEIQLGNFVWQAEKEIENIRKHGVNFKTASQAFQDKKRLIILDSVHSDSEGRLFCIGKVGEQILTVRFTYRKARIRIFGAGYWRKGRRIYETEQKNR
ncbi:MAG: hypothetical protein COV74_01065 [Candidatus Omnitrophica bacterium CG11_big_fil_rev_8_21_14_0_20_45_26]|uniref:BrnT family toxin n=1 Tax=Candidatus Abzuiibacterium crystallinum TaxID=1974748 RepID=A0A2H0LSI5_9BACT|nr:MAG: hypothetical protein COV74_01065 [Candidatus Omnitrophica bacterium CG11_big_fil_rev_8_21_14_0_20_45_26]PIW64169.1 MAG: hypothetical protein COW12_07325 [Candidatus Omnitrophica bacterium CG12_big_fil_rev_8_21_14_0_65_45_16]